VQPLTVPVQPAAPTPSNEAPPSNPRQ
jgi:hypothetical protein